MCFPTFLSNDNEHTIFSLCWPELADYGAECNMPASEFHNITFRFFTMILIVIFRNIFIMIIIVFIRNITIQDPQYSYGMGLIMGSEELPMTNITFDGVVINIVLNTLPSSPSSSFSSLPPPPPCWPPRSRGEGGWSGGRGESGKLLYLLGGWDGGGQVGHDDHDDHGDHDDLEEELEDCDDICSAIKIGRGVPGYLAIWFLNFRPVMVMIMIWFVNIYVHKCTKGRHGDFDLISIHTGCFFSLVPP